MREATARLQELIWQGVPFRSAPAQGLLCGALAGLSYFGFGHFANELGGASPGWLEALYPLAGAFWLLLPGALGDRPRIGRLVILSAVGGFVLMTSRSMLRVHYLGYPPPPWPDMDSYGGRFIAGELLVCCLGTFFMPRERGHLLGRIGGPFVGALASLAINIEPSWWRPYWTPHEIGVVCLTGPIMGLSTWGPYAWKRKSGGQPEPLEEVILRMMWGPSGAAERGPRAGNGPQVAHDAQERVSRRNPHFICLAVVVGVFSGGECLAFVRASQLLMRRTCQMNLLHLHDALTRYRRTHDGQFPSTGISKNTLALLALEHRWDHGGPTRARYRLLSCPCDAEARAFVNSSHGPRPPWPPPDDGCSYSYQEGLPLDAPQDCLVMWDKSAAFHGGRRMVVLVNGASGFMRESTFQKRLREQESWVRKRLTEAATMP